MSHPPGAGATSFCELPDVGSGNRTWVLCKNSVYSWLLSHFSSPRDFFFQYSKLGDFSTWEVESRRSGVQAHTQFHREFGKAKLLEMVTCNCVEDQSEL